MDLACQTCMGEKTIYILRGNPNEHGHMEFLPRKCPTCDGSGTIVKYKTGAALIANERNRQMTREGWTPEHDDKHEDEQLVSAATCYLLPDTGLNFNVEDSMVAGIQVSVKIDRNALWPFNYIWWKPSPKDRIKELIKAGALIAAEIDRLLRLRG